MKETCSSGHSQRSSYKQAPTAQDAPELTQKETRLIMHAYGHRMIVRIIETLEVYFSYAALLI